MDYQNIVKRRVEDYKVLIESSRKYVGVEKGAKDLPSLIEVFAEEYGIIPNDMNSIP